jgi:hypothetical protein
MTTNKNQKKIPLSTPLKIYKVNQLAGSNSGVSKKDKLR